MPTFVTPEPIDVTLEVGFGTVRITAGVRADSHVQVLPDDPTSHKDVKAAERTLIEYGDGHLRIIDPTTDSRAWLRRSGSIKVTVELPSGSHLDARIAASDLRCDGHLGRAKIHSSHGLVHLDSADAVDIAAESGDIVVNHVHADAHAQSTYRGIRIGVVDGEAVLSSGSGAITLGTVAGPLRAESDSGDIAVEHALADVNAHSKHGSIRLGEVVRGSVTVETGSGSLDLGVGPDTTAELDVDARHGTVQDLLTPAGRTAETVGIRATTLHGGIVLRRS